jgi:predicted Zn finger-like uncharacterized protein
MVIRTIVVSCPDCQSETVIRHGKDALNRQRYRCKACGRTFGDLPDTRGHSAEFKARVLAAYQERPSMRGVCRIFGISRNTLISWLKKSSPAVEN